MEITPDTSGYMIAGYIIAYFTMGIYTASMYIRNRNLKHDVEIIEFLQAEEKRSQQKKNDMLPLSNNLKLLKKIQPELEIFIKLKEAGAGPHEVGSAIRGKLRAAYQESSDKGVELALQYIRLFTDKKNCETFPYGRVYFMSSGGREIKSNKLLEIFNSISPELKKSVSDLFLNNEDGVNARRGAFRKEVASAKIKKAVAAALKSDFSAKKAARKSAFSAKKLVAPPGTRIVSFGGREMIIDDEPADDSPE